MEVSMPFECFSDPAYFDMWAVRDIENRSFNEAVHVVDKKEAERLVERLNTLDRASNSGVQSPQADNSAMDAIAALADKWCDSTNQPDNICVALYQFTSWTRQQHQ